MPGEYRTTPHPLVKAVLLAANATRLEVRVDSSNACRSKKKRKCVKSSIPNHSEVSKKRLLRGFFKEVFMYWFNDGKENVEWLLLSTKSKNKKQKQTNKQKRSKMDETL